MLQAGSKAPDFTLPDQDGNPVALSDFRGKRVVLYFYSKDNTAGCTRQANAFAGAYEDSMG
jgi:peroxiredoxin Q/BCP